MIEVKPKEFQDGENCPYNKGSVVRMWATGDSECNAYSTEYGCGGIYHKNYMDIVGNRDHDCFWECSNCHYKKES